MAKTNPQTLKKISVFLSLILRHSPQTIGIKLDHHGWADVDELIKKINRHGKYKIDLKMLQQIVAEDSKQRYSFSQDGTKIRANQGHSIPVDVELKKDIPPDILYHGTAERFYDSIMQKGLVPMSRLYVHLSKDTKTAETVGKRHGKPIIFEINAKQMQTDGYEFFLSENGVWLTKAVPTKYLKKI